MRRESGRDKHPAKSRDRGRKAEYMLCEVIELT